MVKKLLLVLFIGFFYSSFSQSSIGDVQSSPNPFEKETIITFTSSAYQNAFITVKNVLGKTVYRGYIPARKGKNSFPFKRGDLKPGIYIYAIQSNKDFISKRFVIK